ncbi:hypothetical protein KM043_014069 [Ampulex compressa]|nr:hypothetical protein KM043_014069 [Ampulex compressa]
MEISKRRSSRPDLTVRRGMAVFFRGLEASSTKLREHTGGSIRSSLTVETLRPRRRTPRRRMRLQGAVLRREEGDWEETEYLTRTRSPPDAVQIFSL